VCLQETHFTNQKVHVLRTYQAFYKNRAIRERASGGVAIYVKDDILCTKISLETTLEAIAVSLYLPTQKLTVCNVYLPPNATITVLELSMLIEQLPRPFVLLGDFNAHNVIWGSNRTDTRGEMLESLMEDYNLVLLNSGANTRLNAANGTFSAIDLTLCSPTLAPKTAWEVEPYLHSSDHYPIKLHLHGLRHAPDSQRQPRWNMQYADFQKFAEEVDKQLPLLNEEEDIDNILNRFNKVILEAAHKHVRKVGYLSPQRLRTVPWWNAKCAETVAQCKRTFHKMKRNPTIENIINFKKARAKKRFTLKQSKKESWQAYVSTITSSTPIRDVWSKVGKIRGVSRNALIRVTNENGDVASTNEEAAELLATQFQNSSSSSNYDDRFLSIKVESETERLPTIELMSDHPDDKLFTMTELDDALLTSRTTSPGPDDIPLRFIQNLSSKGKERLLQIYNLIWTTHRFPQRWTQAIVLPFKKPNKTDSMPSSYRPISLTCNMCKVLEKMVNRRLLWRLESNNLLSKAQNGFRKHRSTLDNIVNLESTIRKAFAQNHKVLCVFFDLEKAFDMTWRHSILKSLNKWGIQGHMFYFIRNFLTDRGFRVQANGVLSKQRELQNGCPQGSVLSPSLFLTALNDIGQHISYPLCHAIYADDLIIYTTGKHIDLLEREVQNGIDRLESWTHQTGYRFSSEKTKCILFSKRRVNQTSKLTLYSQPLAAVPSIRFLGIIFDSRLNWKAHITSLHAACTKALGLLRSLASQNWGADTKTLLSIYRSLIRSRIEYGLIAFGACAKTTFRQLEVIQNAALRIALGAFRTTPTASMHVLCQEPPLTLRLEQLTLIYAARVSERADTHSNYRLLFTPHTTTLYSESNQIPPISERIRRLLETYSMSLPSFYITEHTSTPPWTIVRPSIFLDLAKYKKADTPPSLLVNAFHQLQNRYPTSTFLYTDGSKIGKDVGAAVFSHSHTAQLHLAFYSSIFCAELVALLKALRMITESEKSEFVVCTDSCSALQALQHLYSNNPLVREISEIRQRIHLQGKELRFIYSPSHIGIRGNDEADTLAKMAAADVDSPLAVYNLMADFTGYIKSKIWEKWQTAWNQVDNHLHTIQPIVRKKILLPNDRKSQVVISRLRSGHTSLTHSWLLDKKTRPTCSFCQREAATVPHLLRDCPALVEQRGRYKLDTNETYTKVFNDWPTLRNYLKEINCLSKI
jgi:ribonuclease HI/endonuclease/exonuclease/phosphatase family metal-dependent hydrolase